jgi:hypothetical protein
MSQLQGFALLQHLQSRVGAEAFDRFAHDYIQVRQSAMPFETQVLYVSLPATDVQISLPIVR